MKITCSKKNYGGAFDIDPEMFFTRDDLDQLNEAVLDHVNETFSGNYAIADSYIGGDDNQEVHVEVDDLDAGVVHQATVHVDMRKIRRGSDLRDKYALKLASDIIESIKEYKSVEDQMLVESADTLEAAPTRLDAIKDKFYNAALDVMTTPDFGWERDEAEEYVFVDVTNTDDGRIRIEVRPEVSYEGMEKMADALDPLVAEIDSDAYFDFDQPGIMSAYVQTSAAINNSTIMSSDILPGPGDYNPPEDDSYEFPDVEEKCTVEMENVVIIIDKDGSWEYEDTSYPWARESEERADLYSDEFPNVMLSDHVGTVENVDEVIESLLPEAPGRYVVSGTIELVYDITGVIERPGEDIDEDSEYYTDDAEVTFNVEKSSASNFECTSTNKDIESSTAVQASTFNEIPGSRYWFRELDGGDIQVSMHRPYDDADYFWAKYKASEDMWLFCKSGKVHQRRDPLNIDPIDDTEWVADALKSLNSNIGPRMMHN